MIPPDLSERPAVDRRPSKPLVPLFFAIAGLAATLSGTRSASASAPADQYAIQADTVFDRRTGLTWQRSPDATPRDRADAAAYCAALTLGDGTITWRLPTVKELMTLADPRSANPAIDTTAFPTAAAVRYWASTVLPQSASGMMPAGGWTVDFGPGANVATNPASTNLVRCVH